MTGVGQHGDSPLDRYRQRKEAADALLGKVTGGGTDYTADVLAGAEALIAGNRVIVFMNGCQIEAYNLAVEELRHRLTRRA